MVRIGFNDCGKIEINLSTKSFGNENSDFKLKHLNTLSIFYDLPLRNKTLFSGKQYPLKRELLLLSGGCQLVIRIEQLVRFLELVYQLHINR